MVKMLVNVRDTWMNIMPNLKLGLAHAMSCQHQPRVGWCLFNG